MANEKKLSSGFLLFIGLVFAACGVAFRYVVMDDRADESRGWMTSHAWVFLVVAGAALVVFAITKMMGAKSAR
jgi:predicted membrane channel-forming protein YqfA (hemolysin III family)